MGLADSLHKNEAKRTRASFKEIRPSKMNKYPIEDIEELAKLIEKYGQLQPIIVYEDLKDDEKKYTILGGERRWNAFKLNYENNKSDGILDMLVYPAPVDEWEEQRLLRIANTYRPKDPNIIYMEIKQCEEEYEHLCELGQKPSGLKRDWIGMQCGMSGRRVDDYLNGKKASVTAETIVNESKESAKDKEPKEKKEKQFKDVVKALVVAEKSVEKAMMIAELLEETEAFHEIDYLLNKVREVLYPYQEKLNKNK